jgi:hypothetical protein
MLKPESKTHVLVVIHPATKGIKRMVIRSGGQSARVPSVMERFNGAAKIAKSTHFLGQ